jgi:capsular exopolysaccharide synthesis family protein
MSRLGAALQRAATGVVARQEPPVGELSTERLPVAERPDEELDRTPLLDERVESGPAETRFREFNKEYIDKLVISTTVPQALREQYRRLGASLHHAQEEGGLKTLMVTSAVPDEGKTLTATNIALTLSESYRRRVLLIDADLRRPSLDEVFMVPKGYGLNEALNSRNDRKVPLVQVSRHLSLLTAGAPDADPMSTLTSDRMRRLIKEAAEAFDWVIMDTPPIGILTDAKLLGTMVDGALLVVRAGRTPAELVQRSVDSLGKKRVVGVILNRADSSHASGADYSYENDYYAQGRKRPAEHT